MQLGRVQRRQRGGPAGSSPPDRTRRQDAAITARGAGAIPSSAASAVADPPSAASRTRLSRRAYARGSSPAGNALSMRGRVIGASGPG